MMFNVYIDMLTNKILQNVCNQITSNGWSEHIDLSTCSRLVDGIKKKILSMVIRTLILEMHCMSSMGLLVGETEEERYKSFEKITRENYFENQINSKYPVLQTMIKKYSENTCKFIMDIIRHFIDDRNEMENLLAIKADRITDIQLGSGDSHNGGKTVSFVFLGDNTIVYKPHSLGGNIVLGEIIDWISTKESIKVPLIMQKYLSKNGYGWEEYVAYTECDSKKEMHNYYYRMGCYLALFSLLGTTDLHYENIIAKGEFPVFIDLETLIGNSKHNEFATVLQTGMLPQVDEGQLIDIDISGIAGKNGKSSKIKNIVVCNKNTDQMCVREEFATIKDQKNIAKYNGRTAKIEQYIQDIIEGYDDVSQIIIQNKESFSIFLTNIIDNDSEYRTVLRHTHVYAKYLAASTHPDFLVSYGKQDDLFEHLEKNCESEEDFSRIKFEKDALKNGDVPCFSYRFDSKALFSDGIVVKDDYYYKTAKELLLQRIEDANKTYEKNRSLVYKALITTSTQSKKCKNKKSIQSRTNTLCFDEELVRKLLVNYVEGINEEVFEDIDSDTAIYYYNKLCNGKIRLNILNSDLYECGGLILTIAATGVIYQKSEYLSLAKKFAKTAYTIMEYKEKNTNTSAFSGMGSTLYEFAVLYAITKDEYYLEHLFTLGNQIKKMLLEENGSRKYDFLNGLSGFLTALSNILCSDLFNKEILADIFEISNKKYFDYVKNMNKSDYAIGLAHGLSGYAYGLVASYKYCHDNRYLQLANDLITKEDDLYKKFQPARASWCKGEVGMSLSRLELLKAGGDSFTLNKYLNTIIDNGIDTGNCCLCHGSFGTLYLLDKLSNEKIVSEQLKMTIDDKKRRIMNSVVNLGPSLTVNLGYNVFFDSDCFMTGKSGIYYYLLKSLYDYLPDIVMLGV